MTQRIGQLTYHKDSKAWTYTPLDKLTTEICHMPQKVQSRFDKKQNKVYYIAWASGFMNDSDSLAEMIEWVEALN